MDITEVRIKPLEHSNDRLRAFCSITLSNALVIRDIKVLEGHKGFFVAMPNRKLTFHCPKCSVKNHLRANYCNECGLKFIAHCETCHARNQLHTPYCVECGKKLIEEINSFYSDIAHPISKEARIDLNNAVISEFKECLS